MLLAPNWSLSIRTDAKLGRFTCPEDGDAEVEGAVGMGDPENVLGNGGDVDPEGESSVGDVAPEAETRDEAEEAMLVERVHNDGNDLESFSFGEVGVAAPLELAMYVRTRVLESMSCVMELISVPESDVLPERDSMSTSSSSSSHGKKLRKRASACHLLAFLNSTQTSIRPGRDSAGSRRSRWLVVLWETTPVNWTFKF